MLLSFFSKPSKQKFILILLLGLLLRIIIIPIYFNSDIIAQGEWASWLQDNGTKGFYDKTVGFIEKPNYPPLINIWYFLVPGIQGFVSLIFTNIGLFIALHRLGASYIPWFYEFIKWFGDVTIHTFEQTSIRYGFLIVVKFLPLLADLLTGGLVYFLASKINPKQALFYLAVYLFFPFSFYVSSYWGQLDPVSALFIFLSFLFLHKRRFLLSFILLTISLNIKPTGLLITPLFIFYYLSLRPPFKTIVFSILSSVAIFLISVSVFTNNNIILYSQKLLYIIFFIKKTFLNVSAFNFWFIFNGFSKTLDSVIFFFLPAKTWGLTLTLGLNLIGFNVIRRKNIQAIFTSIFIVGFGSWLFLTNMYERYLYNGILALFFLSIVDKKYLKYFLLLAIISLINMIQGPIAPQYLLNILELDNRIFAKLLALLNIFIFFRILYLMNIIKLPKLTFGNFHKPS